MSRTSSAILLAFAGISLSLPSGTAAKSKPKHKPGCSVLLYGDANFGGTSHRMLKNFGDLSEGPEVRNQVSSFVVERGTWTLFADENFQNSVGTFVKGSRVSQAPRDNEIDSGTCKPS
jgi:hypothetical protein